MSGVECRVRETLCPPCALNLCNLRNLWMDFFSACSADNLFFCRFAVPATSAVAAVSRRRDVRHGGVDRPATFGIYPGRVPGFSITLVAAAAAFSTFLEDHFFASGRARHVVRIGGGWLIHGGELYNTIRHYTIRRILPCSRAAPIRSETTRRAPATRGCTRLPARPQPEPGDRPATYRTSRNDAVPGSFG